MVQMTKAEEKVVRYAESVNWDYKKMKYFIVEELTGEEYNSIAPEELSNKKAQYIIDKFKTKNGNKNKSNGIG